MNQSLRNSARRILGWGASRFGLAERHARQRRRAGEWGLLLRYHRVIPADEPRSYYRMGISQELFAAQMEWLAAHRRVVSLEEILFSLRSGKTPDRDLVALTFDDGYRDNLTHAAPILRRLQLPAIFYVSAACLTERMPFWTEVLAQALRLTTVRTLSLDLDGPPMSWPLSSESERERCCLHLISALRKRPDAKIREWTGRILDQLHVEDTIAREATPPVMKQEDLRALIRDGFTLGSHTTNHPYLPSETEPVQKREIEESRALLESASGAAVADFCYPGGGYDPITLRLVREAGYRSATTTDSGFVGLNDDPVRLPRIGVGEALAANARGEFSPSLMEAEISGYLAARLRGKSSARRRGA